MPQAYTISYGSWAPDLEDVGVQVPYQWSATPLPVADLSNVYWADGCYRCMLSPSPLGPSLGVQVTNAINFYDNSTGTEEVFAATASGIYMLSGGAWSQVPVTIQVNTGLTGQLMSFTQGALTVLNYAIAPASQSASAAAPGYDFAAEVVSAYNASAYNWSLLSATGGSWIITRGQGTSAAFVDVTSVADGVTASATVQCVVTINGSNYTLSAPLSFENTTSAPIVYNGSLLAGDWFDGSEDYYGYIPPHAGSLSPTTDYYGRTIGELAWDPYQGGVVLNINSGTNEGQSYFTTLYINGVAYASSAAIYQYLSGQMTWLWTGTSPFSPGTTYPISINY